MRVRLWAVAVALLAGGILASVVSTRADRLARRTPQDRLTKWSGGPDPGLHVMPFPGTPDASPTTQIIFSSLTPSALRSVTVMGSRSGRHAGRLMALPDGSGTAFVPEQPFASSETVKVSALLRSAVAGTASGAPGSKRLGFSFAVVAPVADSGAAPAGAAPSAGQPADQSAPKPAPAQAARSYPPPQHFHTLPGLGPPVVKGTRDPDHTSGDIFLTPANDRQHGPMIVDPRGRLVWFDHIPNRTDISNLEVKTYHGKPVLTWWEGKFSQAHGMDGRGVIMDTSYRIVKVVRAGNGYTSDLHEFQLMPQGTAWVDCYVPVRANLTSQGGSPNGMVWDGVIQKIDVRTGRVLWEWHSLGHVPISEAYFGAAGGGTYDPFHLNSIQELSNGKVLVSARNTWALYLIDERTGRIDWTLGGKNSSFRIGPGAGFEWQHDATLHRNGLLSVFDDAAGPPQEESSSSAKLLRINPGTHSVSLVRRYTHSPPVIASYMGSAQLMQNHHMFVGWGNTTNFSEYAPGGHQIFNGHFQLGINSYRAYRFQWHGHPRTPPAVAVSPGSDGAMRVYASWNGATEVARWRVLGGAARNAFGGLGQSRNSGFETGQWVRGEPRYFAVEALGTQGKVLGRSAPVARPANVAVYGQQAFASASSGSGTLPVACFTGLTAPRHCALKATITSGKTVLADTRGQPLVADRGSLLHFSLSPAGRRMLASAHSHQLAVQVRVRDSAGHRGSRQIELTQFTTRGAGPQRSVSSSPTIEVLAGTDFASGQGHGSILAACHAAVRCHVRGSLSVGGTGIAAVAARDLGANEVGYIPFRLTSRGQALLARAQGNQLGVQVKLSNGGDVATGQIALVRYS